MHPVASLRSTEAARIGPRVGQQHLRERCGQKNTCDSVAERGTGMRVTAVFFGSCAPYPLTPHVSVFSHYFKRLDRFTKLATSSNGWPACHGCLSAQASISIASRYRG